MARPGEEVDITGIYVHASQSMAKKSNGFPVFNTGECMVCVGVVGVWMIV